MGTLKRKGASATIVRAMGLFTGVRTVSILCSLVRNKLIAIFIGPAGLGLVILLNSLVDLIGSATRLSIDQSAQRDLSQSSASHRPLTVAVVRRWALWLGMAGGAVTCLASPLLSKLSFDGDASRWPIFCLMGAVVLMLTSANVSIAISQGLRQLGRVAKANIAGALIGLAIAVPLIIWLRIDSIPWIITGYGLSAALGAWIFRSRVDHVHVSVRETLSRGRQFVRLGMLITTSTLITQAAAYAFILFLNHYADTSVLGMYQAGYTLVNTYVGVILTGIWMEYYPRMSALAHSPQRMSIAATHEVRIAMLVLAPVLMVFVLLARVVVHIIYSEAFDAALPFIIIAAGGVLFRAVSWCLAFAILARGDGRTYVVTETISAIVGLTLNIVGFTTFGFAGLGLSYVLWYVAYTIIVAVACRRYGIALHRRVWLLVAAATAIVATAIVVSWYLM